MSEDEIIKIVKDFISYIRFDEKPKYGVRQQYMAIENLLDLYQQEKEKNNDLINFIEGIDELKGINKINELVDIINKYQDDFISKDKIREKIKELEGQEDWYREHNSIDDLYGRIDELKELLEE